MAKKEDNTKNHPSIINEDDILESIKADPQLKKIPPNELRLILHKTVGVVSRQVFTGPIPPPDILASYQKIDKKLPEKIITMAENQSKHRQTIEQSIVNSEISLAKKGQIFGLIISLVFISAAVFCAYIKQPIVGSIIGTGGLTTLVSIFVLGKKLIKK